MKKEIYKPGWSEGMPTMVDHHHHHRGLNMASSYPKPAAVSTTTTAAQSLVGPREQASERTLSSCSNVRGRNRSYVSPKTHGHARIRTHTAMYVQTPASV